MKDNFKVEFTFENFLNSHHGHIDIIHIWDRRKEESYSFEKTIDLMHMDQKLGDFLELKEFLPLTVKTWDLIINQESKVILMIDLS